MEVGDSASDFELEANDGTKISLKSFAGKNNVVLCFYPKNHLFACPSNKVFEMAKSVISVYDEILSTDSKMFAISSDTVESQKKFVEEYSIPYLHLSDTQKDTCKKYPGTNIAGMAKRATFIICCSICIVVTRIHISTTIYISATNTNSSTILNRGI